MMDQTAVTVAVTFAREEGKPWGSCTPDEASRYLERATVALRALYADDWRIVKFYDVEPTMPAVGTISEEWSP